MSAPYKLPDPPEGSFDSTQIRYLHDLLAQLKRNFRRATSAVSKSWAPTNVPTSGNKSIDANAATLDEVRKSLAVLQKDLIDAGILSRET